MITKKAVIFLRVSTKVQTLEQQKSVLLDVALKDYSLDEIVFIEGKESATKLAKDKRKTLVGLFECIEEHPIERVYFYALDRLSRQVPMIQSVVADLASRKIDCFFLNPYALHTLDKNGEMNPIASVMLIFLAEGVRLETSLRSQRVKDKRTEMIANGQLIVGKPAFGYKKDKLTKKIVINEEEAQYVRQIYNMYLSGKESLFTISKKMVELGVYPDSHKITVSDKTRRILTRLLYSGREDKTCNIYPPIVSPEIQDKVIEMLHNNQFKAKKTSKRIYFAKEIIRAGVNRKKLLLETGNECYRAQRADGLSLSIGINAIEYITWINALSHLGILIAFERHNHSQLYKSKVLENKAAVERLNGYIADLDGDFHKLYQAYKRGLVPLDEYEADVTEIKKRQSQYAADIARLETETKQMEEVIESSHFSGTVEVSGVEDYEAMPDENKKALVMKIFKTILVTKDAETKHYFIEFETNDFLHNLGFVYEYWHKGGHMYCIQHSEGRPSIPLKIKKRFK